MLHSLTTSDFLLGMLSRVALNKTKRNNRYIFWLTSKLIMYVPLVISPSSCFAHRGSASTYLKNNQLSERFRFSTVYKILPCPINISFWLWNHYVYRSCSTSERLCDITWTHDKRLRKVCLTFWQIVFPSGCLFWASGWFSALKCVSLIARKSTFLASWLWSRSTFRWIDLSVFKECQRLTTYGFAAT